MPEHIIWEPLHRLEVATTGTRRDQAMAVYGAVAMLVPEVKIFPQSVDQLGCSLTAPRALDGR